MENDINTAAIGTITVLGGTDDMAGTIAFLNFGTGLAVGIIEDGVLIHDYSGAADEIDHVPAEPHRLKCPCE